MANGEYAVDGTNTTPVSPTVQLHDFSGNPWATVHTKLIYYPHDHGVCTTSDEACEEESPCIAAQREYVLVLQSGVPTTGATTSEYASVEFLNTFNTAPTAGEMPCGHTEYVVLWGEFSGNPGVQVTPTVALVTKCTACVSR